MTESSQKQNLGVTSDLRGIWFTVLPGLMILNMTLSFGVYSVFKKPYGC